MLESNRDALFHWQPSSTAYIVVSIDRAIDHQLRNSLFERQIPVHWMEKEENNLINHENLLNESKSQTKVKQKWNTTQIVLQSENKHQFHRSSVCSAFNSRKKWYMFRLRQVKMKWRPHYRCCKLNIFM